MSSSEESSLGDIDDTPPRDPGVLRHQPEIFWRDHQPWLQENGYMLRPRLRPGWVPSWKGTRKFWWYCEDGRGSGVSSSDQSLILV